MLLVLIRYLRLLTCPAGVLVSLLSSLKHIRYIFDGLKLEMARFQKRFKLRLKFARLVLFLMLKH